MSKATFEAIQIYLEKNSSAYFELLQRMVEINSFTANAAGVNELCEVTATAFAELGLRADWVQADDPAHGHHLVLEKKGSGEHQVGFVSHLDTVFPPEEEQRNDFRWRPQGHKIYGPGTVDIKGGTVMIFAVLDALRRFAPVLWDEVTWTVLLNAAEERMATDFGRLCLDRLDKKRTRGCLVFEGGTLEDKKNSIVVARKGMAIYRVTARGRASHAGSAHEWGANAVVQLAEAVTRIAALTDYERKLTFTPGVFHGGTVVNRVPHHAELEVEMRTFDPAIYQEGVDAMLALNDLSTVRSAHDDYPARLQVEITHKMPPWAPNQRTDALFAVWQAAAHDLGVAVVREERGGLSDGNQVWAELPTIDGLGPSGGNAHCSEASEDGSKEQEFIDTRSFVPKALLNVVAIQKLFE